MSDIVEQLREELKAPEYSEGYAESFLDSYIATQIKVLREQHQLSQKGLAELLGTGQGVISRVENVNYSKWNVSTLKKLARAFRVRLKVSFETYGSLLNEVQAFSREALQREPRESDSILYAPIAPAHVFVRTRRHRKKRTINRDKRRPVSASPAGPPTPDHYLNRLGKRNTALFEMNQILHPGAISLAYDAPHSQQGKY